MWLPRAEYLHIRYKSFGFVTNTLFMVCELIKGALSLHLSWRTIYTASPVPWNGAGDWADGKPWISMLLCWNEFATLTHVTFFAFGLSTNVCLTLLISWLLALYAQSVLWIMANCTCMALQWSDAKPSWSIVKLFCGLAGENWCNRYYWRYCLYMKHN